jgi:hypothetical protein
MYDYQRPLLVDANSLNFFLIIMPNYKLPLLVDADSLNFFFLHYFEGLLASTK